MPALQGAVQLLPLDCVCHKLLQPLLLLLTLAPILEGSLVKWFTDSQTADRIVEVGSIKLDLHRLAIKIFQFCAERSIRLRK